MPGVKKSNQEKWPDATRWGYKQASPRLVYQDPTQEELPPLCRERSLAEASKGKAWLAARRQARL